MKTLIILLLSSLFVTFTFGQNVGIGVATPQTRLHIKGGGGTSAPGDYGIFLEEDYNGVPRIELVRNGSGTGPGGYIDFNNTISDYKARIIYNQSGTGALELRGSNVSVALNLGVGTASPVTKLHVVGGTLRIDDGANPYTFPTADGTAGQVLTTDGAGNVSWATVAGGGGSDWTLTGNAGTVPATNFLGTTDNQPLMIRTNNIEHFRLTTKGQIELLNTGQSVFIGEGAGNSDDLSINQNVFIGYRAGYLNTSGSNNTAIGAGALYNNNSSNSTAVGDAALYSNTIGLYNTAIGANALTSNTIGNYNTAVGTGALQSNTSDYNTALGTFTLASNTTGSDNTGVGNEALSSNTTGSRNLASGSFVLSSNTSGNNNTASGYSALSSNTSGDDNTASGVRSLFSNTTGIGNTAVGSTALYANTIGNYNTSLGYNAYNVSGANYSNSTALGANTTISASNQIHLGNASITEIAGQVNFTTYSDARIKENVTENVVGLPFIMKLRPVTYNLNIHKQNELMGIRDTHSWEGKYDIEKIRFSGFLAQEVAEAARAVNYKFSAVKTPNNNKELYKLTYAEFVVPLVKAVQEQQKIIEKQQKEIEELRNKDQELRKEIEELKSMLNSK